MAVRLQTDLDWRFSKKVEHVLVSQDTPKLQAVKLFSFFKNYIFIFMHHIVIWKQRHLWTLLIFSSTKIWQPVTLQPLEAQGHVLHFWKPPINICLEPDCQGGCSVLKVCQVTLKSWGLLNKLLYASDLKWAPMYHKFVVQCRRQIKVVTYSQWERSLMSTLTQRSFLRYQQNKWKFLITNSRI